MRLERIEINGFKSFSDRSEIAFDKGVTAIVGPNGCGKSNVADAITWVMGEQSAKSLRGERMEDVIFNGSDARKPTAAAEVRLRFAGVLKTVSGPAFPAPQTAGHGHQAAAAHADGNGNGHANGNGHGNGNGYTNGNGYGGAHEDGALLTASDGAVAIEAPVGDAAIGSALPGPLAADVLPSMTDEIIQSIAREVELTRRLYRSGESEYLIDGRTCRLRDVHDLLMDTGLGAKAYAIIEQGKIGLILSSRPTDRRQLIEEAAGITKYKARRRTAELKLDAAKQNLTRVDDIVFEVEKQRGTLKRQAGKARRYQKLRDELRRWEKVLFARKHRQLAETIESTRGRLAGAREREAVAAAHVAGLESDLGRLRIELVEAEALATGAREAAHARELAINRREQQVAFDREQAATFQDRIANVAAEIAVIDARREPAQAALAGRRGAAIEAAAECERASDRLASDADAYDSAHREVEGLESDVEAARSEVFSALNSATALRHALEHAGAARDRVAETINKLDVEAADVRIELERAAGDRTAASDGLRRAHEAIEATRIARVARESELASASIEHEWRARSVRAEEQKLAGLEARLTSLAELEAARAGYGDAPRAVLAQANGKVNQQGAVADYLDVDAGYERAVEACLGDLLQYVVVDRPEYAAAGFDVVREAGAGRCGFLIAAAAVEPAAQASARAAVSLLESPASGLVSLTSIVRAHGPFAAPIGDAIGAAWIANSYESAQRASQLTSAPIATMDGVVFRGSRLVSGGSRDDARGILETKREIKELRERMQADRTALARLADETAALEGTITTATHAIAALNSEYHKQEKAAVGFEAQLGHSSDEAARLALKGEQLAREHRQAEEERDTLDRRQDEARASIIRLQAEQRGADERLTLAQRRLFEAREAIEDLSRRAADSRAAHAALVERASALAAEVQRLEEAAVELNARAGALAAELDTARRRVGELGAAIVEGETQLDEDVRALDALHVDVQQADDAVSALRVRTDEHDGALKEARGRLDVARALVADLDLARVTAEGDLSHLAASCLETVQATLDDVRAEVDELERAGDLTPDARVIDADEPDEDQIGASVDAGPEPSAEAVAAEQRALSAEEAIARLRSKIDRLGPVNMMAIEQFDELEARHTFLTVQRKDLVDSIAQTTEAIKRIDDTTRERFNEAFAAINHNFQETFSTLFGGGRAGLTLLDESDPLESGIEIIAQPPGKRLQSVQLLSGGEKALTAIALMFGMFKYKPSPFCLLDEIDAPLDDVNIGRFVEMLRGMQRHTQFIVITHNRKTMEIADRLYGVTMEEPGVSKLISVQLN
jgi:chromosome segregation protein